MAETINWLEVERLMQKCVRGDGYVPDRYEQRLLERAYKSDFEHYLRLHGQAKRRATDELRMRE